MAFSVFISYSTHDLANATALQSWVGSVGAQPFVAQYSVGPGQPLSGAIVSAIQTCDLFLLLWSDHARDSDWVPQEIGIARGANKPIVPVVLHSGIELPGFIRELKYLELYKDPTAAVQSLCQDIDTRMRQKDSDRLMLLGIVGGILLLVASKK
jgi:TIR domain-containing protein